MRTLKQIITLKEGLSKDELRPELWKAWKADSFFPPKEKHWSELSDDDHEDFEQHVDDVHQHAKKHNIKNPWKAIVHYTDTIADKHIEEFKRKHIN